MKATLRACLLALLLPIGANALSAAGRTPTPYNAIPNCLLYLSDPFTSEFTLKYSGICPTGFAEGTRIVSARTGISPGEIITVDSTFRRGRPFGLTKITSNYGVSFTGQLFIEGASTGRAVFRSGESQEGNSRKGELISGVRYYLGTSYYFLQGRGVSQSEYYGSLEARRIQIGLAMVGVASREAIPEPDQSMKSITNGLTQDNRSYQQWVQSTGPAQDTRSYQERIDASNRAEDERRRLAFQQETARRAGAAAEQQITRQLQNAFQIAQQGLIARAQRAEQNQRQAAIERESARRAQMVAEQQEAARQSAQIAQASSFRSQQSADQAEQDRRLGAYEGETARRAQVAANQQRQQQEMARRSVQTNLGSTFQSLQTSDQSESDRRQAAYQNETQRRTQALAAQQRQQQEVGRQSQFQAQTIQESTNRMRQIAEQSEADRRLAASKIEDAIRAFQAQQNHSSALASSGVSTPPVAIGQQSAASTFGGNTSPPTPPATNSFGGNTSPQAPYFSGSTSPARNDGITSGSASAFNDARSLPPPVSGVPAPSFGGATSGFASNTTSPIPAPVSGAGESQTIPGPSPRETITGVAAPRFGNGNAITSPDSGVAAPQFGGTTAPALSAPVFHNSGSMSSPSPVQSATMGEVPSPTFGGGTAAPSTNQTPGIPGPVRSAEALAAGLPSSVQQGGGLASSAPATLRYEDVLTPDELALSARLPYAERATTLYSPAQIQQIKADGRWANWLADAQRQTSPTRTADDPGRANTPVSKTPAQSANASSSPQGTPSQLAGSNTILQDTIATASQGTKDCAYAIARQTGESLESAYQFVTSSGGWERLANATANSVWSIIRHPVLSAQAAWSGFSEQASGIRDAVNAGNPSLACQRSVALSASVVGVADGVSLAKSTLSNLRRVISDTDVIASNAERHEAQSSTKPRNYTISEYQRYHDSIVSNLRNELESQGFTSFKEVSFSGACQIDGRCRTDIAALNHQNKVVIIEIKTGGASLSIGQMAIYPQIRNGNAIPVGQVAKDLGLLPGIALKYQGYPSGITVIERNFPGLSEK